MWKGYRYQMVEFETYGLIKYNKLQKLCDQIEIWYYSICTEYDILNLTNNKFSIHFLALV